MAVSACLGCGVTRPQFRLHRILKLHDFTPHSGVLITEFRQIGGQFTALPAPEIIRLHTM